MELFNPEKCMLMRAKDVQKKLDDRTRIPAVDFTDILNDIQSYINEYIKLNTSDKLRIRLDAKYFDDKFKEQGIIFFKQGHLLMPVLVGLLEQHFGYNANYDNDLFGGFLTVELPDGFKEEYDGEAVRAQYKKIHSTK
jgi:hypothetical protein